MSTMHIGVGTSAS